MNISTWTIYWFIKLDSIKNLIGDFGFISSIIALILIIAMVSCYVTGCDAYADDKKTIWFNHGQLWLKRLKQFMIFPILLIVLHHMLPSTKEMATIYVIPKIANSEFVNQTLPNEMKDIYGMAKEWMKENIADKSKEVETPIKTPEGKK